MKAIKYIRGTFTVGALAAASLLWTGVAHAVPALQLYIEGSTYDTNTETWVAPVANGNLRLWVVGTPGNKGDITDSVLVAAYAAANGAGNVSISATPTTTGGYGGFVDTSLPSAPVALGENTSETSPLMNSGIELEKPNASLPAHGEYGAGVYFQTFRIGDFALLDSPTADFMSSFPTAGISSDAQINAYDISVAGIVTGSVHFDVFGTQAGKDVFAPFSHDAEAGGGITGGGGETLVPAPGQATMFGLALVGLGLYRRRQRRRA